MKKQEHEMTRKEKEEFLKKLLLVSHVSIGVKRREQDETSKSTKRERN